GLASRIGSFFENGDRSVRPLDARRGKARLLLGQGLDAVDEAVAEIVGQGEARAISDVAVLVGEFGVTLGVDALGVAVIDDAICLENATLIINLRVADGRNRVLVPVEDEL